MLFSAARLLGVGLDSKEIKHFGDFATPQVPSGRAGRVKGGTSIRKILCNLNAWLQATSEHRAAETEP